MRPSGPQVKLGDVSDPERDAAGREARRLTAAVREARDDAAPFAFAGAVAPTVLALVSREAGWDVLGRGLWWMWLLLALPSVLLAVFLLVGLGRLTRYQRRREIVLALLGSVWVFSVLGLAVLIAALVVPSGAKMTGAQLLLSGVTVWLGGVIAFGLAFWELDCGGPVARALSREPRRPDFQFPQDENPTLAREDWSPRLWDYVYTALTNAIAFSPTDVMPLTRPAKGLMAAGSILSSATLVLVTARAVNILR